MIELQSVSLSFGARTLLDEVNWQVTDGSRVALVGANGVGKSTLLRCIAGEMETEKGLIQFPKNATLGYLPQDLMELPSLPLLDCLNHKAGLAELEKEIETTHRLMSEIHHELPEYESITNRYTEAIKHFEHLGGYSYESRACRVLAGLGFKEKDFRKNCLEFSGGWKMRILLAHILLLDPDLMLLDEPTNHLDTESLEWLEDYLGGFKGTMIAVSHDRRFLEKMMNVTAELSRGKLTLYPGKYSWYLEQKELRKAQLEAEKRRQDEYIEKTTQFIERFRYKATKAAQVQSRIKQLDKIDRIEIETAEKRVRISFPLPPKCSYEVIKVDHLSHGYDGIPVLEDISFSLHQGEKIALVGVNGAGKSTLSRLLSKNESPLSGKVDWGKGVSMGFFAQESRLNLDYSKTIWEEIFAIKTAIPEPQVRSLLGSFLFSGNDINKPIEVLSGGEKSRLALCKLLLERHNLLILDEPTNHLDMTTRDLFQDALLAYKGSLILVSHDRHFLDQIITKVIEIRERKAWYYMGNYSYFLQKRKDILSGAAPAESESVASDNADIIPAELSPRDRQKLRKRVEAEHRKLLSTHKKTVEHLETQIHAAEKEKKSIEMELCNPEIYAQGEKAKKLTSRLQELIAHLPSLYAEWQTLQHDLETRQNQLDEELKQSIPIG